jgi:hypothetical protein
MYTRWGCQEGCQEAKHSAWRWRERTQAAQASAASRRLPLLLLPPRLLLLPPLLLLFAAAVEQGRVVTRHHHARGRAVWRPTGAGVVSSSNKRAFSRLDTPPIVHYW